MTEPREVESLAMRLLLERFGPHLAVHTVWPRI